MTKLILALAAALALAGCTTDGGNEDDRVVSTGESANEDDPMRTGDCDDAVQAIADADGPDVTSEVDMAINICNSLEDWDRATQANPEAFGDEDPRAVLEERCASAQEAVPLCQSVLEE